MNTRQPIQPSNTPAVLSLAFSSTRNRFIAGLSNGLRCFRTDNCLTTYQPTLPSDGGIAIAEQLDDRYLAYVGGGRAPAGKPGILIFWDCVLGREVNGFDFHEDVLGIRLSARWMAVVLQERTIVFEYQELLPPTMPTPPPETEDDEDAQQGLDVSIKGPNNLKALYPTAPNTYALAVLRADLLVLPAQSIGQVQLIPLKGGSKRVLRAHNSAIRCLALSDDCTLLATSSEQGTLIRVFDIATLNQLAEFRRGVDHAIIYGLAFSPGNRWLASTSDKGTLHIFDLRPPDPALLAATREKEAKDRAVQTQHRKTQSYASHRISSATGYDKDSLSGFSGRSSPASATTNTNYQGSVQEYYGLRPPPISASPPGTGAAVSAIAALKASPFAPRIMRDIRSVASLPFYLGDDPPHWQGGPAYSWTTAPNGTKKRVKNAVAALPGQPSGKPPKGLVGFAPMKKGRMMGEEDDDDDGAVALWVIGGGSDARWEMFELLPAEGGGRVLVMRGFRRYLTRQFVD